MLPSSKVSELTLEGASMPNLARQNADWGGQNADFLARQSSSSSPSPSLSLPSLSLARSSSASVSASCRVGECTGGREVSGGPRQRKRRNAAADNSIYNSKPFSYQHGKPVLQPSLQPATTHARREQPRMQGKYTRSRPPTLRFLGSLMAGMLTSGLATAAVALATSCCSSTSSMGASCAVPALPRLSCSMRCSRTLHGRVCGHVGERG